MKIFFSVGEPSGDLHGANLIRQLLRMQPGLEAVGYGGPLMAEAGCRLHHDMMQLAVMGIGPVLAQLRKFWDLATQADRYFQHQRPDAVVMIDYPGFNWWIARRAQAHGIPVFYYGVPQLWAWASWRVKKMRRLVDHVLCKLPFEADWYRRHGCAAEFVGHPYFDQLQAQQFDQHFVERYGGEAGRLVTILPGSRTQEVKNNMQCFVRTAEIVKSRVPDARFAVACYKQKHVSLVRDHIARSDVPIDVFVGRTPELIHLADCCMACSGSVSLELLYHEKPTVIHYRVGRLTGLFVERSGMVKVRFITLVNLMAVDDPFADRGKRYDPAAPDVDAIPFPEYPTYEDKSAQVAAHLVEWLTNQHEHGRRVAQLAALKSKIAHGGASQRAAEYILQHLTDRPAPMPRPHFIPAGQWRTATDMAVENVRR